MQREGEEHIFPEKKRGGTEKARTQDIQARKKKSWYYPLRRVIIVLWGTVKENQKGKLHSSPAS